MANQHSSLDSVDPADQSVHSNPVTTTSDEESEKETQYHEIGSATTGNREVLCPRCFSWINHGSNGKTFSNLESHWKSKLCKEASSMYFNY
jgi:hypothetical protein